MIGGFDLPTSGTDRAARPGRHPRPAGQAAGEHGLPELRPVPPPRRRGQHRVRAEAARRGRRARSGAGPARSSSRSTCRATRSAGPNELSGGQQQRVALARALVNEPNVLLLDEPLGALDLKLRKRLQVELKRIQMDVGITFVYVTHDQEEALTMSDRIAVMHRGRIEQVGAPGGPLRPAGDVVRRRLHRHDEPARGHRRVARRRTSRSSASTRATAASSRRRAGAPGQAVQLSIRPGGDRDRRRRTDGADGADAVAARHGRAGGVPWRGGPISHSHGRGPCSVGSRRQERVSDSNPADSVRCWLGCRPTRSSWAIGRPRWRTQS